MLSTARVQLLSLVLSVLKGYNGGVLHFVLQTFRTLAIVQYRVLYYEGKREMFMAHCAKSYGTVAATSVSIEKK
jgi:hypothetical protein